MDIMILGVVISKDGFDLVSPEYSGPCRLTHCTLGDQDVIFKHAIFNHILLIGFFKPSNDNALRSIAMEPY